MSNQTTALAKRHLKRWHAEAFNLLEDETRRKKIASSAAIDPSIDGPNPIDYHYEVEDTEKSWRRLTKEENKGFWSCFSKDPEDPRYVECLICHQRISLSTGSSISSAKRHLFRKHVDQFNKIFPGSQQPKYINDESGSKTTSERRNSCEDWFENIDESQRWDDDDSVSVKSEKFSGNFLEDQEGEYSEGGIDELADRELSPPPEDEMNDRSESFDRANPIWNYFCQEDGDSKHVRCKLCDKEISRGLRLVGDKCVKSGFANAKRHLKRCHNEAFKKLVRETNPHKSYSRMMETERRPISKKSNCQGIRDSSPKTIPRGSKRGSNNPVWKYVHRKHPGSPIVICNLCQKEVSLGGDDPKKQSTGLAKRHIKRWHPTEFNLIEGESEIEHKNLPQKSPQKPSKNPIWKFMQRKCEGSDIVVCNICHEELSFGGKENNTGIAKRHLRRWHSEAYNSLEGDTNFLQSNSADILPDSDEIQLENFAQPTRNDSEILMKVEPNEKETRESYEHVTFNTNDSTTPKGSDGDMQIKDNKCPEENACLDENQSLSKAIKNMRNGPKKKQSASVWSCFVKDPLHNRNITCKICGVKIKIGTHHRSPLNIAKRHLLRKHLEDYKTIYPESKRLGIPANRFKCSDCTAVFEKDSLLRSHYNTEHNGLLPYLCDSCPNSFLRRCDLRTHKDLVHNRFFRYQCGICQEKFVSKHGATKHVSLHLDKPLYRCSECLLNFQCPASGYNHVYKVHGKGKAGLKHETTEDHLKMRETYVLEIDPVEVDPEARRRTRPVHKVVLP